MSDLHLPMKREYFDAIKAGTKTEEYRMACPFRANRIVQAYSIDVRHIPEKKEQ